MDREGRALQALPKASHTQRDTIPAPQVMHWVGVRVYPEAYISHCAYVSS